MTHYLLSVQNSCEQNFISREFRGISELYKVGMTQKKNSPACFNRLLWKLLRRKDLVLFGFSYEKVVGTLPLFNMGFHNKTACKNSWKTVLSKVLL